MVPVWNTSRISLFVKDFEIGMDLGGLTETNQINHVDNQSPIQLNEGGDSSVRENGASHNSDVCQTVGFVKLKADASSVRFCVEPVAEGVMKHLLNVETPSSDNVFGYCEENISVDDVANGYGKLLKSNPHQGCFNR